MIPTHLTLQNFMCYRSNGDGPLTLNLDGLHVACLSGENGAGKSTLLDAITWVLWGKARMSDDELIAQGESEMQVDLGFILNGLSYRVTRKRQRARSGTRSAGKSWLDLQVCSEQGWKPLGGGKISETEQTIANLLRMSYDTFINASFLLQNRADEFTRKTASERKQVLADILDLHDYAMLEERAKRRARQLDDQIKGLDGRLAQLQQEAEKLDLYTQWVAQAELKVAALSQQLESAELTQQAAEEQVQTLKAKLPLLQELRSRLNKLRAEQQQQTQEIAGLHSRIAEAEELLQRSAEIEAGMAQLAQAKAELERLEELRPRYEALRERWRELNEQIKDVERSLLSERDRLANEQQRLMNQVARRPTIEATLADLEQRLADLAPLDEELNARRQHLDTLLVRISQVNALLMEQRDLRSAIEKRQDSLVAVREEKKRLLKRLTDQLADVPRWQADLTAVREQATLLANDEQQLDALRQREQAQVDSVSQLRAESQRLKEQADQIKKYQALLVPGQATCPVCRSELGHGGIEQVHQHYDAELQEMRRRYSACKKEADASEADLKQLREAMSSLEQQINTRRQQVAQIPALERQLAQAAAAQLEQQQVAAELAPIEEQLAREEYAQEERARLRVILAELNELGSDPAALEQERKALQTQLRQLEQQLGEQANLQAACITQRNELAQVEADAAKLPELAAQLAALTTTIEQGDFAHDLRQQQQAVKAEGEALGYNKDAHTTARTELQRLQPWIDAERRLREAQIRLDGDRRLLQQTTELNERRAADITQITREEAALAQELQALPAAEQREREATQVANTYRNTLKVAERDLTEKQALCKGASHAATQLHERQQERRALAERQGVFQDLAEAFGKKGVQAMLIETAIPEIEREANRLLARMTDNQMHLTFEMQRDTKKGDTVETLEIKIADALGTRTYDAFSGGEAMRVNFAIRVALSRLLAHRAGASLETLVIDEGFGALDATGRERFVEAITSVQQDFKRILVITHIEELKERFPAQIEITKTPQGSRWELR